ncbi:hypothetical protein GE061_003514 [Apolygus lucorum]|uniref:Uncharacterized protein n=1 Tax=Apolygus lucorum TaxID=248454 RepID=A0A6A4JCK3_APOLU|nr:hypothetical protein GE061_003514 [Apolygus lucorum]
MQSFYWGLTLILCFISTGYAHPPHLGAGRLIIGKLVRLRRTAAEKKPVKETEVATTGSKEDGEDLVISPKDKETPSKPDLDGKILLLMIVPPDKIKEGKDGKEGNTKRKPNKRKNKRKILSNIVAKPRASKCKCASELAKQLDVDVELATQLLTNSSMGMIAAVACTKNACPLMAKISEVLNSKVKYISDVRPVITCEDPSTTTTTQCGTTTKEKEKECGGDKDSKDSKDSKNEKNPKNTGGSAIMGTSGHADLRSHPEQTT